MSGFTFDGRRIDAAEGGSVGAALWAAGERAFRRTRVAGAPRSLFCGIGNCFDCLVDLPGRPATRACVTPVETDVEIHRSPSLGAPEGDPGPGQAGTDVDAAVISTGAAGIDVDVAVVGAGPAGLAAARAAGELGVRVALVDAAPAAGGNIWRAARRPEGDSGGPPSRYRRLPANVAVLSSTSVAVAEGRAGGGARLHLDGHPVATTLDAAAVVLATGATEVVHPFPGWDLPGVITAGAAQALLKGDGVVAGTQVLVAGTGPLLLAVAADLARAGARVVLAEATRPRRQLGALPAAMRHPAKVAQAVGLMARLARHRVRVLTGRRLAAVRAVPEGSLLVARLAPEQWLAVDAVCVHHGLAPDIALARALGCTTTTDPAGGEVAVRVDDRQATDRPGVFAAGEVTGIAGAPAAEAEGRVAGMAAALHAVHTLHAVHGLPGRHALPGQGGASRGLATAQRRAARERRFGEVLARLWPVPEAWWEDVEPATTVCRCEEVAWSAVADAVADGAHDLRAVKGRTRAGMGLCQGRVCGPPLQLAVAGLTGRPSDQVGDLASRPIAVPVTLARLARLTPAAGLPATGDGDPA